MIALAKMEPAQALQFFNNTSYQYVSSNFVKLEVLPKAIYHRNVYEAEFYECFFQAVSQWLDDEKKVILMAMDLAERYGLNALDALHVASAIELRADLLITLERAGKPIYRVQELQVQYLGG